MSTAKINLFYANSVPAYRKSGENNPVKNTGGFALILIFSIIISGIFYLIQMNNMVAQGYDIEEYKDKIKNLKLENQNLSFKAAETKSLSYIEKKVSSLNLGKVDKISFVSYDKGVLVQR